MTSQFDPSVCGETEISSSRKSCVDPSSFNPEDKNMISNLRVKTHGSDPASVSWDPSCNISAHLCLSRIFFLFRLVFLEAASQSCGFVINWNRLKKTQFHFIWKFFGMFLGLLIVAAVEDRLCLFNCVFCCIVWKVYE